MKALRFITSNLIWFLLESFCEVIYQEPSKLPESQATNMIGSRIAVPALRSALAPWALASSAVGTCSCIVCG